jgi:hypothetical protein
MLNSVGGRSRLLARPASLGKYRTGRVDRAPQKAGALECLVPLGTRRQQTRTLQRIRRKDFLIDPVWRPLRFFHRRFATLAHRAKASKTPASNGLIDVKRYSPIA